MAMANFYVSCVNSRVVDNNIDFFVKLSKRTESRRYKVMVNTLVDTSATSVLVLYVELAHLLEL